MLTIFGFALIGIGVAVAFGLIEAVIRRTEVGAMLVLGLVLFEEAAGVALSVSAGPVRVVAHDGLFVILLVSAIARFLRVDRLTPSERWLTVFGVLIVWSIFRGAGPFGFPAAINESREFLWFTAGALYFSTIDLRADCVRRVGWLWLLSAGMLSTLTVLRWAGNAVGLSGSPFGDHATLRVISSDAALIIAQGAIVTFALLAQRARGLVRYLTPALLVVVVLLQHRTVWLVTAVGILHLLLRGRPWAAHALTTLGACGLGSVMLMVTVLGGQDVTTQLATSSRSTETLEWRVDGWVALLTESGPPSPVEVAVGKPFGTGWLRTFEGRSVDAAPHNFYVESYLRVGVVGLAAFLLVYTTALRRSRTSALGRSHDPGGPLPHHVLRILVVGQLIYYVTYGPDVAQAMLLGLACATAVAWARNGAPPELVT